MADRVLSHIDGLRRQVRDDLDHLAEMVKEYAVPVSVEGVLRDEQGHGSQVNANGTRYRVSTLPERLGTAVADVRRLIASLESLHDQLRDIEKARP
jgi:hypothetical protein